MRIDNGPNNQTTLDRIIKVRSSMCNTSICTDKEVCDKCIFDAPTSEFVAWLKGHITEIDNTLNT